MFLLQLLFSTIESSASGCCLAFAYFLPITVNFRKSSVSILTMNWVYYFISYFHSLLNSLKGFEHIKIHIIWNIIMELFHSNLSIGFGVTSKTKLYSLIFCVENTFCEEWTNFMSRKVLTFFCTKPRRTRKPWKLTSGWVFVFFNAKLKISLFEICIICFACHKCHI